LTPYATLLIKPTADDDEIRRRYYELSRALHPDHNPEGDMETWQEVKEAYETINTAQKREKYNHSRRLFRLCSLCDGSGVFYLRMKPKDPPTVCNACEGEGKL
jgi:DnaJ-class molecular chaperone